MKLADLGAGAPVVPWAAGGKIPWHEPAFSERMLREHLSQEHDRASRRFETISTHVAWLHDHVLGRVASRVLDLGCGPGFYTSRLARLGHACVGVDFSPASISHARSEAEKAALPCQYHLEDLVIADLGEGFDLALLIFGEINTFPPAEARTILANIRSAVGPSGALVMEVASEKHVRSLAAQARTWFSARQSVFSDEPHLRLKECAWHDESRTAIERYVVVTLQSSEVAHYASTTRAYSDDEYGELLGDAGFRRVECHASLSGGPADDDAGMLVLVARETDPA